MGGRSELLQANHVRLRHREPFEQHGQALVQRLHCHFARVHAS